MRLSIRLALLAGLVALSLETCVVGHEAGLGLLALTAVVWLACRYLAEKLERKPSFWVRLLWLVPASFAAAVTRYDASTVATWGPWLNGLGLVTCAGLTLTPEADLLRLAEAPGRGVALLAAGPFRGPGAVRELAQVPSALVGRILKGVLAALPLLALFTLLFAAADEMFARLLGQGLEGVTLGPAFRILLFATVGLGFLKGALAQRAPGPGGGSWGVWDPLATSVTLVLVNLLFLAFLTIQARYLFGGQTDLPVWEYARRGFFELATCTALVFGLALFVYQLSEPQGLPRLLTGLLVAQTFGVGASALYRMTLYSQTFGLSVLRIYATLGILAMGFGLTILLLAFRRDWVHRESHGLWLSSRLALAGMLFLAAVAQLDVEGGTARYNLERWAGGGRDVDLTYLGQLSCDAAPALEAHIRQASPDLGVAVAWQEIKARQEGRERSWQAWNLSRRKL